MTDYAATVPARFLTTLDVRYMGWKNGRPDFMTLEPFSFFSRQQQKVYTVPAGSHINGASVPRAPIVYLLYAERGFMPAGIHDYLCDHPEIEPRHIADLIFLEALEATGEPPHIRDAMYAGVRLGALHGEAAAVDQAGFVTGTADG